MAIKGILIAVGFICVGVLLIVSGIRKKGRCSCRVVGRITGIHEREGTDNEGFKNYDYTAEYEYEVNGQIYHDDGGPAYSNPNKIQIGGNIDIYYNPEKPDEHYTKGGVQVRPLLGIAAILLGAFIILTVL